MARIQWDQTGERYYETGVDRGVLHIYNSVTNQYDDSHAWNGLTAVSESPSGAEPTPLYADNIKYLNLISAEEFGATVEAYTYPEAFARCDGSFVSGGVSVGQQRRETFGLSYRTRIGNDIEADQHAYKIHLVWGATAAPTEKAYATVNDTPEAISFSWTLSTTAVSFDSDGPYASLRPMATMTIDSRNTDPTTLREFEDILYGSADTEGSLPSPDEVLSHFSVDMGGVGGGDASAQSFSAPARTVASTSDTTTTAAPEKK